MHRPDEPALRLAVALANDPAPSDLRRIFAAVAAGDQAAAVATINALIDLTRNASRRFCTPRCANRHHVTAYRERRSAMR